MSDSINITVPDIGDFDTVEVIELLVKVGDTVRVDQSLITVESDKASMEIPSSHAGVVTQLSIKVGDKVKQGSVIAQIAAAAQAAPAPSAPTATKEVESKPIPAQTPAVAVVNAGGFSGKVDHECDLVVLGAGPGGYSAAFRAADLGLNVILIERYATLGGVCLNVGCIPSKALLHTAAVLEEAQALAEHGIGFGAPKIDLDKLRAFKDGVIGKLTGGLAGMARARKVTVLQGSGSFVGPNHLSIASDAGASVVKFSQAIIAAGSQSVKLPFLPADDRIVDSTGALLLRSIPKRMLIIGGGIIGLEMGTVYSALGARLDVVEMQYGL
ncbi:MAG: FAD-dependent oxidoreductase, partial [Betaproteobacteria bacterium]